MSSADEWLSVYQDDPSNELVCFTAAKALCDEKRLGEALPLLENVVKMQQDFALAYGMLGRVYLNLGRRDDARVAAEKGLELSLAQKHEVPEMEARAVLDELDSEF